MKIPANRHLQVSLGSTRALACPAQISPLVSHSIPPSENPTTRLAGLLKTKDRGRQCSACRVHHSQAMENHKMGPSPRRRGGCLQSSWACKPCYSVSSPTMSKQAMLVGGGGGLCTLCPDDTQNPTPGTGYMSPHFKLTTTFLASPLPTHQPAPYSCKASAVRSCPSQGPLLTGKFSCF